jgi:hypothetical protein
MRWMTLILGMLLLAGCGGAKNPRHQAAGGVTGDFAPVPDPPRVGLDSGFVVTLSQNGAPLTGAQVSIATFFRGLNQTGPTGTFNETAPGRYEATGLTTGMNGKWEAEVVVSRSNQPDVKLTFPFTVAK